MDGVFLLLNRFAELLFEENWVVNGEATALAAEGLEEKSDRRTRVSPAAVILVLKGVKSLKARD